MRSTGESVTTTATAPERKDGTGVSVSGGGGGGDNYGGGNDGGDGRVRSGLMMMMMTKRCGVLLLVPLTLVGRRHSAN